LLGQHKLTAGEVCVWFREENRHLPRKHMLAVNVLMQRVEVALAMSLATVAFSRLDVKHA